MAAPYAEKLLAEISKTPTGTLRSELIAELACYWARSGEARRARRTLAELRKYYGQGEDPKISVWIMCLEGLLLFHGDIDPGAFDKFVRANVLAEGLGYRHLISMTTAWMSVFHFNASRFPEMRICIDRALETIDPENNIAHFRTHSLISDAFIQLDQLERSNHYFSEARKSALALGDHAAFTGLFYNRVALKVFLCRVHKVLGLPTKVRISLLIEEVNSAIAYQRMAQIYSLDQLLALVKVSAQVFMAMPFEAINSIQKTLVDHAAVLNATHRAILRFDQAECMLAINRSDMALGIVSDADCFAMLAHCDAGERVICADIACRAYRDSSTQSPMLGKYEQVLESAKVDFLALQKELADSLQGL